MSSLGNRCTCRSDRTLGIFNKKFLACFYRGGLPWKILQHNFLAGDYTSNKWSGKEKSQRQVAFCSVVSIPELFIQSTSLSTSSIKTKVNQIRPCFVKIHCLVDRRMRGAELINGRIQMIMSQVWAWLPYMFFQLHFLFTKLSKMHRLFLDFKTVLQKTQKFNMFIKEPIWALDL